MSPESFALAQCFLAGVLFTLAAIVTVVGTWEPRDEEESDHE